MSRRGQAGIPPQEVGGVPRRGKGLGCITAPLLAQGAGPGRLSRSDHEGSLDHLHGNAQGDCGIVGPEGFTLPGHHDCLGRAPKSKLKPKDPPEPLVERLASLDVPWFLGVHPALVDQGLLIGVDRFGDSPQVFKGLAQPIPGPRAIIAPAKTLGDVTTQPLAERDGAAVQLERLPGVPALDL
jgi:hypothetical protein